MRLMQGNLITAASIKVLAASAIAMAAMGLVSPTARAELTVTEVTDPNLLLNSLLGDSTGLSDFAVTTTGTDTAQGFGLFSNDTVFGLGSGVVLSTGNAVGVVGPNDDPVGTVGPGFTSQLNIEFFADNTVESLFFSYVFGSDEFFEFAQAGFNDSFQLELNGVNLALLPNGKEVTIDNLATFAGPIDPELLIANPGNETQLDAFTRVLKFQGKVNKNTTNRLIIRVSDAGDSVVDSAVFIKGGSLGITDPDPEPIPTPALLPGLVAMGIAALRKAGQHQQDDTVSE